MGENNKTDGENAGKLEIKEKSQPISGPKDSISVEKVDPEQDKKGTLANAQARHQISELKHDPTAIARLFEQGVYPY